MIFSLYIALLFRYTCTVYMNFIPNKKKAGVYHGIQYKRKSLEYNKQLGYFWKSYQQLNLVLQIPYKKKFCHINFRILQDL